ncbi:branched-chain amino acid ABC transporter permease [Streptomyces malaysiensis]|uniref:branched-chain amino acid ABC transporter permease n=1 Tax=Streptomyces malaysiensis TaxID=92644 RepID=UPI002B2DDD54|nr:branched-chain amino acid ABC transporter permease [Streptomyces malaysiensis]
MLFPQLLLDGLGKGAVYAALALALVLVYRSTGLVNFAQGEFATLSAYLTWTLTASGLNVWAALLAAIALSAVVGAAIEWLVIRPLLSRSHLLPVIMMIALYIVTNAAAQVMFGPNPRPVPSLFPDVSWNVAGLRVSAALIGVFVVEAAIVAALWLFFERSSAGLAFRAVATAPEQSKFVGIRVNRLLMLGWGLAAAVGAVAAVLLTNLDFYLQPDMMSGVLVYSLAAITLGGFDSPAGAITGGLIIGVLETLASGYLPGSSADLGLIVALAVIVCVLSIRPQGLRGRPVVARV